MAIKAADVLELIRPEFKKNAEGAVETLTQPPKNTVLPDYESQASKQTRENRLQSAMNIADRMINEEGSELAGRFIPSVN